ncbi:hypothetical protein [Devosia psychrophila]|nr:hypothetical protein [Devosia psychrophila]
MLEDFDGVAAQGRHALKSYAAVVDMALLCRLELVSLMPPVGFRRWEPE